MVKGFFFSSHFFKSDFGVKSGNCLLFFQSSREASVKGITFPSEEGWLCCWGGEQLSAEILSAEILQLD